MYPVVVFQETFTTLLKSTPSACFPADNIKNDLRRSAAYRRHKLKWRGGRHLSLELERKSLRKHSHYIAHFEQIRVLHMIGRQQRIREILKLRLCFVFVVQSIC